MSDFRKAEKFLDNYGPDYVRLLDQVRRACLEVRARMGPAFVDDIYGRKESVGGDDALDKYKEFKEPAKIAAKARQRNKKFLELTDIVGLTAVLQYPDQIENFIGKVAHLLAKQKIVVAEIERHVRKNGYFATHVIFSGRFGVVCLYCELQVKTILHDAWSAKMHDLTYKPMGMLDTRLAALMASIADTIDSLEDQSRLIRDMIKSGWNVEESTRRIARRNIFEELLKYWKVKQKWFAALRSRIESAASILEKESHNHPAVVDLMKRVNDVCENPHSLRYGWMLAGRIASFRPSPEYTRFFMTHADAWLDLAPTLLKGHKIHEKEISAVPLMFYVTGDLERAIDYSVEILDGPTFARLSRERRAKLNFNLATFMIEREYHAPTLHPGSHAQLKREVEAKLSGPSLKKMRSGMESEFRDTEGLLKIAFADTKEQARSGIEDCVAARSARSPASDAVIGAYADLNMRLGWRRYFELELREGSQAKGAQKRTQKSKPRSVPAAN